MATETTTPTSTATSSIALQIPPAGQTIIVELQPNQIVEVPFDMAEANITLVGNDLRFEFPGNAVLILTDFAALVDAGTSPLMIFADGSVVAGDVILTALSLEVPETAAGPGGGSGGAGEYEDDMGALLAGITRLGPQNPDPFAKVVEMSLLDEQPLLPVVPPVPAPVNNPPVAEDNVYRLTAGQLKAILASEGLFSNDYDPDGDPIIFTRADNPPSVTINTADGSLTIDATTASELYEAYRALDEGETLSFTFPYTIADPSGLTATANVTIIVEGVNDPPTITTDPGNPEGANDMVYEAGLSPHGTNAAADSEFAYGSFKVADPDGLDDLVSVTINGTEIAIADLGKNNLVGGTYGNLTITGYDPLTGEGTYKYELTKPTMDVNQETTPEFDTFTLTTSDGTVSSAPAAITIEIVDDQPSVEFSNSIGSASSTVLTGMWSAQTGADFLPNLDYVSSVVLDSAKVNGVLATTVSLGAGSYDLAGNLNYAGSFTYEGDKQVSFTLTLKTDGTYTVELPVLPTRVEIEPSEYAGAVKASGPTETYILSYQDVETGQLVTAKTFVADEGLTLSLLGTLTADGASTQLFAAKTVGDEVNPSGDGIGIENNLINSYVDSKTGALTAESLTFDPTGAADTITLNFKATGAPGFGQSGSEDVLYIKVVGTEGGSRMIMLDSRYGDFSIDGANATAISGGYDGGGLDAYTINNPFSFGAIDYIEVTAGFYTYEQGKQLVTGTTEVKVTFGFTTETTTIVNLPVEMNFTATVVDADGDSDSSSFAVYSVAEEDSFIGTDGDDMLTGSEGGDIFAYSAKGGEGVDTIKDFSLADGDVLRFHDVLDGNDGGSDLGVADVNASVFATGDDITITINETTQVVIEGLNAQIGLSDGAHTLADLPASMLDFTAEPHTI